MSGDEGGVVSTISPGERQALRTVVRQRIKVLRVDLKQRKQELNAEISRVVRERYADFDAAQEDYDKQVRRIQAEAIKKIQKLHETHRLNDMPGRWEVSRWNKMVETHAPRREAEKRQQVENYIRDQLNTELSKAEHELDRKEAELLSELAIGRLESPDAKAFLDKIPTIDTIAPLSKVYELEQKFPA